jgi:hypothetical protein
VRLLTVRQPWAEAIARAEADPTAKLVENRSRGFPKRYRGLVGIHAGQAEARNGWLDYRVRELQPRPHPMEAAYGAVIALADLADVHPATGCCQPWGEDSYQPNNPEDRPVGQVTHLVLDRVVRIRPVPAKGALGLWHPDTDLLLELCHRVAERITWDQPAAEALADRMDLPQLHACLADDVHPPP